MAPIKKEAEYLISQDKKPLQSCNKQMVVARSLLPRERFRPWCGIRKHTPFAFCHYFAEGFSLSVLPKIRAF